MKVIFISCLYLFIFFHFELVQAQDGPGGIGNTSGTSPLRIWFNAESIIDVYDKNNLTTWTDLSGYGSNAVQNASANKPNFQRNFINGFAAVSFNGSSEYMDGTYGSLLQAPLSVFTAGYFAQTSQLADDSDFIFSAGNTAVVNYNRLSVGRVRSNDVGNADKFINNSSDATLIYGPVLTGGDGVWTITGQVFNSSPPYIEGFYNGAPMALTGTYSGPLLNEGNFAIGRYRNGNPIDASHLLNGNVGEIIVFNKVVNAAERKIVSSYLSAKYNVPIADDIYTGDDGVNGDNDRDVVGIGKEADGVHSISTTASLTITIHSNFDNGDFVSAGHGVSSNSINTVDPDMGGLQGRWERAWWLDVTDSGTPLSINMSFDLSESGFGGVLNNAANYKLIYRNSGVGAWTELGEVAIISGDKVQFSNVPVSTIGDGYFTLATSNIADSPIGILQLGLDCDGPAGVGATNGISNLNLWLDANKISGSNNDPILTWADESGNGYDAVATPNLGIFPQLKTNSVNGVHGQKSINFSVPHYFSGSMGNLDAPATIIAVPYFGQPNQADVDYVIAIGGNGAGNQHTSIARRAGGDLNRYSSWDGGANRLGAVLTGNSWMILTQYLNSSGTFHDLYINGTRNTPANFTSSINTNGVYDVGRFSNPSSHFLLGNIAEIIIYDKTLNAAELAVVHSYLAAKYDLTVANDKYTGDTGANGDYDLNVAGIGQSASDGGSALAGTNPAACAGGLTMSVNSNFQDGDFVLFGHRTLTNSVNTLDISADIPELEARWERDWFFDITDAGPQLTVDITFDFSSAGFITSFAGGLASNYKLLYRPGLSGAWTSIASGTTYASDQLTFSNINLINDGYYALGSIDISTSPLPIELVSFSSKIEPDGIRLDWITASEVNFDRFVVERSLNGIKFQKIGEVVGMGNIEGNKYEFYDHEAVGDKIYYRLKMLDLDHSFKYSAIVSASVQRSIKVYPNPVDDFLYLLKDFDDESYIEITDQLGHVQNYSLEKTDQNLKLVVDVRAFKTGLYFIKIIERKQSTMLKFLKK